MKTRILTARDVESLVTMADAVSAVEHAFTAHGRGETQMPAKVYIDLPEHRGDFRAMPSAMAGAAGVKWVNSHPDNPAKHGLPSVMGLYILSDPATAAPLAVLDATLLTAMRTGAAAGVATRHLARADAKTCGFVGCGVQSRTLWAALSHVRPGLEPVCADANAEAAAKLAEEIGGRVGTLADAAGCDVVSTATPVSTPIVERAFVQRGSHINAMGADAHGKQELDVAILKDARVFLDDMEQACGSGEVNVPLSRGDLSREELAGTLGEVIAGSLAGRSSDDDITVFDSTGLAVQDLALARVVFERATERGVGLEVDF